MIFLGLSSAIVKTTLKYSLSVLGQIARLIYLYWMIACLAPSHKMSSCTFGWCWFIQSFLISHELSSATFTCILDLEWHWLEVTLKESCFFTIFPFPQHRRHERFRHYVNVVCVYGIGTVDIKVSTSWLTVLVFFLDVFLSFIIGIRSSKRNPKEYEWHM